MASLSMEISSSPFKRKRSAPVPDLDEGWDVESLQVESVPSKKKKARFQLLPSNDDVSSLAPSSAPSLADTNTATVTVADTESPRTEASSSRSKSRPRAKKYHCTFVDCNKAFDRPIRLQTHINSHTGERPHHCQEKNCEKSFYKPEHLNRHMHEKHGDASFVCTFEVRKDDTGAIEPCGKTFASSSKLKRHIAVHEDKEETTCSWEGCGKIFRKQETLQRHLKKDHLNEDPYICMREVEAGGTCGQSFPTPRQLQSHEAKEHDAPKYVCEICTNAMVDRHVDLQAEQDDLDPAFLPTAEDLRHTEEEVDPHILSTLSLSDVQPTSLQNSEGLVGFPTYHELLHHNKVVHPPTCTTCGKECKSSKDLAAHIDIHHPMEGQARNSSQPEKSFLCPYEICARSEPSNGFSRKGNLDVHIKSAHSKTRAFICGSFDVMGIDKVEGWNGKGCGVALGTKQSLIGHIRTQHLNLPALLGERTGLQKTNKKQKPTTKRRSAGTDPDEAMDMEIQPNQALSMLTGIGYEQHRPYPCFLATALQSCQMRFTNVHQLGMHMELTHEWNVDDINDVLQQDELDQLGIQDDVDDEMLRRRLEAEMGGSQYEHRGVVDPQLDSFQTPC